MTQQFVMRAFNTATNSHVYWAVLNTPDLTGAESGYNPADLTNIVVDYSFEVPINGSGGPVPPGLAGGDLTGTYPNPNVAKIAGTKVGVITPTDGQVLTYVSANSDWEPKPSIAGGGNAGGDLSGTYPNPTVSKIHSATVPVAGSLTPGNVLQVSGASALSYAPVNLAGGTNAVSGQLPTGNQVPQNVGGDLSGTTTSATVAKLDGYVLSASSPIAGQVLEFNGTNWVPSTISSSFPPSGSAGGDLGGTYPSPNVIRLQGRAVASITPQNGYVLTWNTTNNDWEPARTFAFEVQPNLSWTQMTWFIDPQSSFGGNDSNDGLTSSTPIKTWAEVVKRFGTYSPLINQNTTFTFLSNHIDNSDPVIFTPYLGGAGINVVITGILNSSSQVSTGAFSGLIAKNRDTGELLTTTLTNTPIPGWFVHNVTRDGYSWVYQNPGSNVAVLSQTLISSVAQYNSNVFTITEIDTTTNGDIYVAYEPVHVNIVQVAVQMQSANNFFSAGRIIIQNLTIFDPNGVGQNDVIIGNFVILLETRIDRWALINQFSDGILIPLWNCNFNGGGTIDNYSLIFGGILGGTGIELIGSLEKILDADVILGSSLFIYSGKTDIPLCYIGQSSTIFAYASSQIFSSTSDVTGIGTITTVWGPGNINVDSSYIYDYGNFGAVNYFKNTGTILINSKSTAYSFDPTGNGKWRGGIQITPAKLDASLSDGGFSGTALIPEGGIITKSNDGYGYIYTSSDSLSISNWYIDPQVGNNANNGKSPSTPIQTWAELIKRWGTRSPLFSIPVTVTFLSDQLSSLDPISLTPGFTGSGSLTVLGTLQHQMDGHLASVVSKNKSATGSYPAGLLQANLTASADGYAGYLLVNNSRGGAICWINTITSGSAVLTNPFVSNVPTFNPSPNQVDTFANGDAFSIYQPTKIYVSGFLQGVEIGNVTFAHLWFIDPVSVGSTTVLMPFSFSCMETRLDVLLVFDTIGITGSFGSNLVNSWCNGNVSMSKDTSIIGGGTGAAYVGVNIFDFTSIDGDVIIQGNTGFNSCQIGSAYIDNSNLVIPDNVSYINGDLILDISIDTNYQFGLYGKYVLGFSNAVSKLTYLNGTAIQWFGGTPTFLMDGVSFANTYDRSVDPAVWYPARPLTVANLDLPVIQGGFGGLAIGDSGYIINNGVQTSSIVTPNLSFFVDPSNVSGHASDGYDGLTDTTPILTLRELNKRLNNSYVTTSNTITLMSNVLSTDDPLNLSTTILGPGGSLFFLGTPQIKKSTGILTTNTVPIDPLSNQRQIVEDTVLAGWDGYVGYLITDITNGYDAWIVKVDGYAPHLAFTTRPYNLGTGQIGQFSSGDTYKISIGSDMLIGNLSPTILNPPQNSGNGAITFQDFNFLSLGDGINYQETLIIDNTGFVFNRCKFADPFAVAYGNCAQLLLNCNLGNSPFGSPGGPNNGLQGMQVVSLAGMALFAGLYTSYQDDFSDQLTLGYDVYVTGWGLLIENDAIKNITVLPFNVAGSPPICGAQFHDCISPTAALSVGNDGRLFVSDSAGGLIWGTGNDGYGIVIQPGTSLTVDSNFVPSVTGVLGDFAFNAKGGLTALGRAWDESTGLWSGPITTTWAHFVLDLGSGGFGYNAHYVGTNSGIVSR